MSNIIASESREINRGFANLKFPLPAQFEAGSLIRPKERMASRILNIDGDHKKTPHTVRNVETQLVGENKKMGHLVVITLSKKPRQGLSRNLYNISPHALPQPTTALE